MADKATQLGRFGQVEGARIVCGEVQNDGRVQTQAVVIGRTDRGWKLKSEDQTRLDRVEPKWLREIGLEV